MVAAVLVSGCGKVPSAKVPATSTTKLPASTAVTEASSAATTPAVPTASAYVNLVQAATTAYINGYKQMAAQLNQDGGYVSDLDSYISATAWLRGGIIQAEALLHYADQISPAAQRDHAAVVQAFGVVQNDSKYVSDQLELSEDADTALADLNDLRADVQLPPIAGLPTIYP